MPAHDGRLERWLFRATFALLVVMSAALSLAHRYLPLVDWPEHLAQDAIVARAHDPASPFAGFYRTTGWFLPYQGFRWLHIALARAVDDVALGGRLALVVYLVGAPLATLALVRRLGRDRWVAFTAFALLVDGNLLWGFAPHALAAVLVLVALCLAIDALDRGGVARCVALALLGVALFFTHAQQTLLALALVTALCVASRASIARRLGVLAALLPAGALLAVYLVGAGWVSGVALHDEFAASGRALWHAPWRALRLVAYSAGLTVYGRGPWACYLAALGAVALGAWRARSGAEGVRRPPPAASAVRPLLPPSGGSVPRVAKGFVERAGGDGAVRADDAVRASLAAVDTAEPQGGRPSLRTGISVNHRNRSRSAGLCACLRALGRHRGLPYGCLRALGRHRGLPYCCFPGLRWLAPMPRTGVEADAPRLPREGGDAHALALAVALGALFFALPAEWRGQSVAPRLASTLLASLAWLVPMEPPRSRAASRALAPSRAALVLCAFASLWYAHARFARFDAATRAIEPVLALIPRGARLGTLVYDPFSPGFRLPVLLHVGGYAVALRDARASFGFTRTGVAFDPSVPRAALTVRELWLPSERGWRPSLARVGPWWQYALVVTAERPVGSPFEPAAGFEAHCVLRSGRFELWAIARR